jgi:hypothetical protein
MFCEHANEVPMRCPCDSDCYCKDYTCRSRVEIHAPFRAGRTQLSFFELLQRALTYPGSSEIMVCTTKESREVAWQRWKNTEWHVIGFVGFHDIAKRITRFENGSTVEFRHVVGR